MTPQSSSSSPKRRAYQRVEASTASAWRQQRLALGVARERLPGLFTGRLQAVATIPPPWPTHRRRDRGRVLRDRGRPAAQRAPSGPPETRTARSDPRRVPAHRRSRSAAQRPAHPRRGDDAGAARRPRRRRRVAGAERGAHPRRRDRTSTSSTRSSAEPHPRVVPARRPAARALRPRRRAAAGRRRDRPPADRHAHPRADRARRRDRRDGALRHARERPARPRVFLDEASVMATENAVMAASLARADGDRERRLRAARPGSLPLPHLLGARIEGIGSNVLRIEGVDRLDGGEYRIAPEHIEVGELHRPRRGDRRRPDDRRTSRRDDLVSILPAFERLGIAVEIDGTSVRVPPGQELVDPRRPRRPDPEDRGRPMAGFPRRPDSIARRGRDPGPGHDPDLREDVREPPVLRRQAGRRWARASSSATRTGGSSPALRGCTASEWRARTSARHGDADRGALRRGTPRSATSARSTAATSESTSACATLAPRIERIEE